MQKLVIYIFITLLAGLLLTNIYTSMVDAYNWSSGFPDSIETARAYFKTKDPGDFFRIFSPLNQFAGFLSVILFWHTNKRIRLFLVLALGFALLADLFTFMYFYPRNAILFLDPITDMEIVRKASSEWITMNWIRTLVVATGLFFAFRGLHEVYKKEYQVHLDM